MLNSLFAFFGYHIMPVNEFVDLMAYRRKYSSELDEHLKTLQQFNAYIDKHKQESVKNPFTQEEIRAMIRLCHPDKHGNKQIAVDITAKLIKMREE